MEKKLIEAALFMSPKPLSLDELAKISGVNSLGFVKDLLEKLKKDYDGRGIHVVSTPQGWEFQIKQDLLTKVAHLTPYSDISEGAKRSLALIASREPLKQSDLISVQGNKAYSYVKELHNRGLVSSERHGRSRVLKLTQEFERYFGEDKSKIKKRLQEATDYKKEKVYDFVEPAQEKKSEKPENIEKKVKPNTQKEIENAEAKEIRKPETKDRKKGSASSGEIPW